MKYMWMRLQLTNTLYDLSNKTYQINAWVKQDFPEGVEYDCFDEPVHFLFDDSGLGSEPEKSIGQVIYADELDNIKAVTSSIDSILKKYGTFLSDEEYINKPEWQGVLDAAKSAYTLVVENNQKHQLDIQVEEYYKES